MAKIVLFADGTGNARTGRFTTNVWKLYNALDGHPDSGQVAFYHDGVGTSSFAPLRLLGGVFGIGLGRNIRQLYAFLCRNITSPNDEIHLFGFSRGAFTVRILAGLIASQGVRPIKDEAELNRWVVQAYRANRLRIALPQVGVVRGLLFRVAFGAASALRRKSGYPAAPLTPDIEMVGVWDTVAAYGGPIVEIVRAFDRWIWPLSMPDYRLNMKVRHARHALALDEEREAFLPLPWDEVGSERPERIKQVWFAGVHSDVGGGYADEGLSGVTLEWMLDEAKGLGLDFLIDAEDAIRVAANAWAPMHDSRSGLAVGYRYQPRSVDALMGLTPNSPLRDPESGDGPLITKAVVHASVLSRIQDPDGYAPIVLPTTFEVDDGRWVALPSAGRDRIWRLVGARRWMQRLLLLTCLLAALAPLYWRPPVVSVVDERARPIIGAALALVPLVPAGLKDAYAGAGSWLALFALLAWVWLRAGDAYRERIGRVSAGMWTVRSISDVPISGPAQGRSGWWLSLRRAILRRLRWRILPGAFGLGFYVLAFMLLVAVVSQVSLMRDEARGRLCALGSSGRPTFEISEPCHALGVHLEAGGRYRVRISVGQPWMSMEVPASPDGLNLADLLSVPRGLSELPLRILGISMRREIAMPWIAPVIALRTDAGWLYKVSLAPRQGDDGAYYAHFTAPAGGWAGIYVNEATLPWSAPDRFYKDDLGTARVEVVSEY